MRIFQLYDCFKKNMLMAFAFRPNSAAFALSSWHFGRTDDEIPGQRKHNIYIDLLELLEINISKKTNVINVQVHLQNTKNPSLNVRAKHANSRHKSLYGKLKLEHHYMANLKAVGTHHKTIYNFNQCPTSRQTTSMAETLFIKHMGLHGSCTTVAFSLTNPRYGISSLLGLSAGTKQPKGSNRYNQPCGSHAGYPII